MNKTFYIFFTIAMMFSCKEEKKQNDNKPVITENKISDVKKDSLSSDEIVEQSNDDFDILIPREYRDFGAGNDVNALTKKWLSLYKKNGKYYLEKANYTITRGYSECSGDSTKIINPKNESVLLINNQKLALGEVKTINIDKNKIWPKEKMKFSFENQEYTLRAEGKILSTENVSTDNGDEIYHKVENYKLYLSTNNSDETLLLEEKSFNDTFVELLFIGDIDRDGKPDFIFSANRDYEEERVVLFLSSKAGKGKLIRKVAEVAVQFDC